MRTNQASFSELRRKSRLLWPLCITLFGAVVTTGLVGGRGAQVVSKGRLSAQDPRPLARAVEMLQEKSGVPVTYEDPLYVHGSEVADVTAAVRRDAANFRAGKAPKVLIPKGGALAVDYDVIPGTDRPADPEAVVRQLVQAHNGGGNAGRFRVERSGKFIHVIPSEFRNAAGDLAPQPSALDAVISLPEEERSGLQTLKAICDAVGGVTQTKVVPGTIPLNLFMQHHDRRRAVNQKARDVLVALLESTKRGADLSWRLLYDPGMRTYALNIRAVPATK